MGRIDAQEFLNRQRRDFPACECNALRTKVAELEATLRPAEGLPTWREWVEIAISHDHHTVILRGGHTPYRVSAMTVFDIDDCEADQLCAALGRDPKTGWKAGEE